MSTNDTVIGKYQGRGDNDFIQLLDKSGANLGGWDADGVGYGVLAGGGVQSVNVEISSAELLALKDTPVEIIPAAAAGQINVLAAAILLYTAGGTPYTISDAADSFQLRYSTGGTMGFWAATGIVDEAVDKFLQSFVPSTDQPDAWPEAASLDLILDGVDNLADGDGTVKILASYYTLII